MKTDRIANNKDLAFLLQSDYEGMIVNRNDESPEMYGGELTDEIKYTNYFDSFGGGAYMRFNKSYSEWLKAKAKTYNKFNEIEDDKLYPLVETVSAEFKRTYCGRIDPLDFSGKQLKRYKELFEGHAVVTIEFDYKNFLKNKSTIDDCFKIKTIETPKVRIIDYTKFIPAEEFGKEESRTGECKNFYGFLMDCPPKFTPYDFMHMHYFTRVKNAMICVTSANNVENVKNCMIETANELDKLNPKRANAAKTRKINKLTKEIEMYKQKIKELEAKLAEL